MSELREAIGYWLGELTPEQKAYWIAEGEDPEDMQTRWVQEDNHRLYLNLDALAEAIQEWIEERYGMRGRQEQHNV